MSTGSLPNSPTPIHETGINRNNRNAGIIFVVLILAFVALASAAVVARRNKNNVVPVTTTDNTLTPAPGTAPSPSTGTLPNDNTSTPTFDTKPVPVHQTPPRPATTSYVTVPSGTPVAVDLQTRLSTKTNNEGDPFTATMASPIIEDGRTVIPAGARVNGHLALVEQPGKSSGRGQMQLAFDEVSFGGHSYALGSRSAVFQSKSGAKKDRELVGGGAAAGGIIGGIIGKNLGNAAKGAVIGGATGAAVSLLTRGPQLEFEPGTQIQFTLDQPVQVPVKATS